jgi:hypothetical protein
MAMRRRYQEQAFSFGTSQGCTDGWAQIGGAEIRRPAVAAARLHRPADPRQAVSSP